MVEDLKWTGVCSLKYVEAKHFQRAEGFEKSFLNFLINFHCVELILEVKLNHNFSWIKL